MSEAERLTEIRELHAGFYNHPDIRFLLRLYDSARAEVARLQASPGASAMGRASKIWYSEIDGKPQSPGWIIAAYARAIEQAEREAHAATWAEAIQMVDDETHISHNFAAPPIVEKMRQRALAAKPGDG